MKSVSVNVTKSLWNEDQKYELTQIQLLFHMIDQAEGRAPLQIQDQITPAGTAACL